ncbi:hypothetical protein [Massilia sp. DD77]|uniref:hypothetical protein n=1 Tax=Massilia sp. DD77 TaxID=3109349 RepID=UPI002FFFAFB7
MLAHEIQPAVHAGEDQSSIQPGRMPQFWSINPPEPEANSLAELASENGWLRVGDVVYVTTSFRHTLTDADLNAAARALIGVAA